MRSIAAAAKNENERLISIIEQTHRDSKFLKALSVVATMYLMASLVAVSAPFQHLRILIPTVLEHNRFQPYPGSFCRSVTLDTRLRIAPQI